MFRNPRDGSSLVVDNAVTPSVGRPPTPPLVECRGGSNSDSSPYFSFTGKTATASSMSSPSQLPVLGRQSATKSSSAKKNVVKQNQSILNFFGKTPNSSMFQENTLFFKDPSKQESPVKSFPDSWEKDGVSGNSTQIMEENGTEDRYNETSEPLKRRRISVERPDLTIRTPSPERGSAVCRSLPDFQVNLEPTDQSMERPRKHFKRRGGFIDDSDDEEGGDDVVASSDTRINSENSDLSGPNEGYQMGEDRPSPSQETKIQFDPGRECSIVPTLSREGTSMFVSNEFDDDDDFENDEFFEGGEEFMERRWMQEQQEMEIAFDGDSKSESDASAMTPKANENLYDQEDISSETVCPICSGSLKDLSEVQASAHVNACLDGNAQPLPTSGTQHGGTEMAQTDLESTPAKSSTSEKSMLKRFQRATVARPGQSNPFGLKEPKSNGGSAFSRLMSGHAEDTAWAAAAASEMQSRGKPAYQRTCPFYKIMPGLYICVDAFRYGKVEGQNAYFLSHFHSDHYIGLTSSWCHGPIYASKVTTNLIRQQLRVDQKWLVPLEFEKKIEIPNTKGVQVTMIPANHCPGSSLFLFEKITGKNKDGSPRLNRILHCGDFRACPAHVAHPLLKPDVVDAINGQTRQQTIDTCYLDTTYLTPKYSFPSQHDVIDACAKMCVSLSKEIVDGNDSWEKVKLERAGSTMTKFLEKGESGIKREEGEGSEDQKPEVRGKLLVVIGTYSIGKERICLGIARALGSKIYAPPGKMRICNCLEDDELKALLTSNPLDAQVHMQTLMEIRAETLHDYLVTYKGQFSRVVGFRPTGWSYRPPTSRFTENPAVNTVLHSDGWKSRFTMRDLAPQRGSTKESNCFGVPYSEHSSFRELTMFVCALRIGRVVPTVNVGSAKSREKMKGWIEKWEAEKKKNGLFKVEVGCEGWGSGDGKLRYGV